MFEINRALSWTFIGYPRRREISRRSAFARFTRYSASLICPAIATAVASSSMKSLFTAFDPTKKPLLARLSAARTTPSEHVIPMVVVMGVFPGDPMAGRGHIDSTWRERVTFSCIQYACESNASFIHIEFTCRGMAARRTTIAVRQDVKE